MIWINKMAYFLAVGHVVHRQASKLRWPLRCLSDQLWRLDGNLQPPDWKLSAKRSATFRRRKVSTL